MLCIQPHKTSDAVLDSIACRNKMYAGGATAAGWSAGRLQQPKGGRTPLPGGPLALPQSHSPQATSEAVQGAQGIQLCL